jgi:uncharacterized protein YxeA
MRNQVLYPHTAGGNGIIIIIIIILCILVCALCVKQVETAGGDGRLRTEKNYKRIKRMFFI